MAAKHKELKKTLDAESIVKYFKNLDINLDQGEVAYLAVYLQHLLSWNKKMNLVGFKDWQSICSNLIIDSWYLAGFLNSINFPDLPFILDLGAGAGLPGIPLRIFWPKGQYVMVECRQKRSAFLQYVLSQLNLANTQVFSGRVEDLPADMRGADLIVSRAFCPWPDLLSLTRTLLNEQGKLVVLSNEPPPEKTNCPEGWEVWTCKEYYAGEKNRYFWLFVPIKASS